MMTVLRRVKFKVKVEVAIFGCVLHVAFKSAYNKRFALVKNAPIYLYRLCQGFTCYRSSYSGKFNSIDVHKCCRQSNDDFDMQRRTYCHKRRTAVKHSVCIGAFCQMQACHIDICKLIEAIKPICRRFGRNAFCYCHFNYAVFKVVPRCAVRRAELCIDIEAAL